MSLVLIAQTIISVMLYECSMNDNFDVTSVFAPTFAFISDTGHIRWLTTSYFVTSCPIDVTQFPMDTQVCPVHIGSRTSSDEFLVLAAMNQSQIMEENTYVPNGQWNLTHWRGTSITTEIPGTEGKVL